MPLDVDVRFWEIGKLRSSQAAQASHAEKNEIAAGIRSGERAEQLIGVVPNACPRLQKRLTVEYYAQTGLTQITEIARRADDDGAPADRSAGGSGRP
jgi:hypothetical protein